MKLVLHLHAALMMYSFIQLMQQVGGEHVHGFDEGSKGNEDIMILI